MLEKLVNHSTRATHDRLRTRPVFLNERFNEWKLGVPASVATRALKDMPLIVAVGGGKGGVGKSVISANLAVTYAQQGFRVLVVDLDLGCSNLHTHFGVAVPKRTLLDYAVRKQVPFIDVMQATPMGNVAFIAAGREEEWSSKLDTDLTVFNPFWDAIFAARQQLKVDVVIFDLGAGTNRHTMTFFNAAHLGLVTVLPEPTSIENAYVFLRMALWDLVTYVGEHLAQSDVAADIQHELAHVSSGSLAKGYVDCFRRLINTHPEFIHALAQALKGRHTGIIVNQVRNQNDIDIGKSMEHICQKYFGFQARFLGFLNHDESVINSLRNRHIHVLDYPQGMVAKRLTGIVQNSINLLGMQGV